MLPPCSEGMRENSLGRAVTGGRKGSRQPARVSEELRCPTIALEISGVTTRR